MAQQTIEQTKTPNPIPPYVPFKTFKSFISGLREMGAVPGRIDRSLMYNQSGAVQGQLMAALKYLDLITANGTPTDYLKKLVGATEGAEQKTALRDVLTHSYGFLFGTTDFDPRHATSSQLSHAFSETGATGETVRKCVAFLLLAAQDAEMPLSPYFKTTRAPRGSGSRSQKPTRQVVAEPERANGSNLNRSPLFYGGGRPAEPLVQASNLRKEILGALAQLPEGEAALTADEIEELVTVYRIALRRSYLAREPRNDA
jgi:hypothetical protein